MLFFAYFISEIILQAFSLPYNRSKLKFSITHSPEKSAFRFSKDADLDFFKQRIEKQPKLFSILAYNNDDLIGFKVGYPYDETTFYSWIGGVLPNHQQQGIAKHMAKLQEKYARSEGFTKLRTKSMNQYKTMMILNLKNGFDITKVYTNAKGQTKIVFEKLL